MPEIDRKVLECEDDPLFWRLIKGGIRALPWQEVDAIPFPELRVPIQVIYKDPIWQSDQIPVRDRLSPQFCGAPPYLDTKI